MDNDEFLKEIDQQIEWFCDRTMQPVPHHPEDVQNVFSRMVQVGWIRQSEYDMYKELTKEDD